MHYQLSSPNQWPIIVAAAVYRIANSNNVYSNNVYSNDPASKQKPSPTVLKGYSPNDDYTSTSAPYI